MLVLLELIPKWALALLLAAALATAGKLEWDSHETARELEKKEAYVAQLEATIANANAVSARVHAENEVRVREATDAAARRQRYLVADIANADDELSRLHALVSLYADNAGPGTSDRTPADHYTATFAELLLQCGERYTAVAAAADGHASDVKTLVDAWPAAKAPVE